MLAACVAVLSPLRDIISRDPLAAITPKESSAAGADEPPDRARRPAAVSLAATAILLGAPKLAILGMVLLIGALLLSLPARAAGGARACSARLARSITSAIPHVAAMELQRRRARRAIGDRRDRRDRGIRRGRDPGRPRRSAQGPSRTRRTTSNAFTDVWVSPAGAYNLLRTAPFTPAQQSTLRRLPGVRAVRVYRGGLLDWGDRRIWVIAPPSAATPLLPASAARRRLRRQGRRARCAQAAGRCSRRRSPSEHHLQHRQTRSRCRHPTRPRCGSRRCPRTRLGAGRGDHERRTTMPARGAAPTRAPTASCWRPASAPPQVSREITRALGPPRA